MIQVDGLSIAYQGRFLFEDASFTLQRGERCGLVGRNGSGKSTLFKLLMGREVQDSGQISFAKYYRIGTLDQHIHFSKSTLIEEACEGLPPDSRDQVHKAEKILFGLGFKEQDMPRQPEEFSGGYQLRLHLAKVLLSEPDCLLLDEPTNYLDIVSIRWFARFLQKWRGEFVLITHDREFMDSVTTHTMGIHRQKIKKVRGNTVSFFEQILQEEEIHEKTRQNLEKKRAHLESFIDRFGAKASKAAQAQSKQKQLNRIPVLERLKDIYSLNFHFNEAPFSAKKMLDVQNLSFSFDLQGPLLIQDLSLTIEKGDRIAIIGKNGRGKSTILRLLNRELIPTTGTIHSSEHIRTGYFGQTNIHRLHPSSTVEEEVGSSNPKLNRTEIKRICGLMMFGGDLSNKQTAVLSGGEKSRVLLGKILASPCNLLMLDEPTHHLDMESVEALIDALEDFEGAVVIVTHSELILNRLNLHKIIICHEGRQDVFLGDYGFFLEKDGWNDQREGSKEKKKNVEKQANKKPSGDLKIEKALKSLNEEIEKKEMKLSEFELLLDRDQKKLAELYIHSESSNHALVQELAKSMEEQKSTIDSLYEELDRLYTQRKELMISGVWYKP